MDEWNSGAVFSRIRKYLEEKNISTNLNQILHNSVLPENNQMVYVYKVPHQPNTWEYFEYETDNTSSKFFAFDPAGGSWFYQSWKYRKEINITENSGNNLTEYQINLTIDTQTLISEGKMNSSCKDIRFTYYNSTSEEETEIPYWIESGCNTSSTKIWVKVPYIPANGNATIYMYYGNMQAESESNFEAMYSSYPNLTIDGTSQTLGGEHWYYKVRIINGGTLNTASDQTLQIHAYEIYICLLYTSPSPRD